MTILFGIIALLFLVWFVFNVFAVLLIGVYNSRQKNKMKENPVGGVQEMLYLLTVQRVLKQQRNVALTTGR